MTDLASSPEAIEFLIDGARYGDAEDVIKALDEYKVAVDATDEQGRTGKHLHTIFESHLTGNTLLCMQNCFRHSLCHATFLTISFLVCLGTITDCSINLPRGRDWLFEQEALTSNEFEMQCCYVVCSPQLASDSCVGSSWIVSEYTFSDVRCAWSGICRR